ncbi:universal stress protein [Prescottella sp. R16]|uniref:universal stress protein n=1 Tax=Prescottella sp. R16 TaxID=3064529 RepID=UPI00272ED1F0|nr:universal stress protein [Prescottella sp. R16]
MVIAVAFDDSPEGRWAAVYAARAAMQRREQLLVLRIVDDVSSTEPESVRTAVRAALDAGGVGESPWELRTAEHSGDPVGALIELIADSGAALFVAGTRRRNAVGKFLLDRTLQRILLEVEVPVLVVKEPLDDD